MVEFVGGGDAAVNFFPFSFIRGKEHAVDSGTR